MTPAELDLDEALEVATEAAVEAGRLIIKKRDDVVSKRKSGFDIVTNIDFQAQKLIIGRLKTRFKDHRFLAEESRKNLGENQSPYEWIIDPLDGTVNYVAGLPMFSVSVALRRLGKPILGVVYDPAFRDLYTAIEDRGSFRNGHKLAVSRTSNLGSSVLSFMLTSHYDQRYVNHALNIVRKLATRCRGLRLYVSQALELALAASGRFDGVIGVKSKGFSSGAGVLLVRESGGTVTDLHGVQYGLHSKSLLATNGLLHKQVLGALTN
jgi:myo-inositol-1(or 4)-monophosphatase